MTPEIKEAKTDAQAEKQRWEEETLENVLAKTQERKSTFEGVSLEPVERLYTEEDSDGIDVGFPGEFPYKRGIQQWQPVRSLCLAELVPKHLRL